jgi:hypothetical protein
VHRKYIPIYIQQDATLHSLFVSANCSTCFGWYFHPSSGAYATHSTLKPVPTLPRKRQIAVTVWQIPNAVDAIVCAPDDGWKYQPKHVEQFPDINKLCNFASCWIYIGILLGAHSILHISSIRVNYDSFSGPTILSINHPKTRPHLAGQNGIFCIFLPGKQTYQLTSFIFCFNYISHRAAIIAMEQRT